MVGRQLALRIRPEESMDMPGIRTVNHLAFGRDTEADLVDKIRRRAAEPEAGPLISLVAALDRLIVGHIFFSPVFIQPPKPGWAAAGLGPVAVTPAYQGQGIGSALVETGLEACCKSGYTMVFVLGHSDYYPRFGFLPAAQFGMVFSEEVPPEAFMVQSLKGTLERIQGTIHYLPEFHGL